MKAVVRTNFDDSVTAYDAYEQRTGRFTALATLLAAELSARATVRSSPSSTPVPARARVRAFSPSGHSARSRWTSAARCCANSRPRRGCRRTSITCRSSTARSTASRLPHRSFSVPIRRSQRGRRPGPASGRGRRCRRAARLGRRRRHRRLRGLRAGIALADGCRRGRDGTRRRVHGHDGDVAVRDDGRRRAAFSRDSGDGGASLPDTRPRGARREGARPAWRPRGDRRTAVAMDRRRRRLRSPRRSRQGDVSRRARVSARVQSGRTHRPAVPRHRRTRPTRSRSRRSRDDRSL